MVIDVAIVRDDWTITPDDEEKMIESSDYDLLAILLKRLDRQASQSRPFECLVLRDDVMGVEELESVHRKELGDDFGGAEEEDRQSKAQRGSACASSRGSRSPDRRHPVCHLTERLLRLMTSGTIVQPTVRNRTVFNVHDSSITTISSFHFPPLRRLR